MSKASEYKRLFASNRFGPFEISIQGSAWYPLDVAQTRMLFNPERVDIDLIVESLFQGYDVSTEVFTIRKRTR